MNTSFRDDFWVRYWWIWSVIFYGSLLISILSTRQNHPQLPHSTPTFILIGIMAVAHAIFSWYPIHSGISPRGAPLSVVYMLGLIACWYQLVTWHPSFNYLLFGLYSHIFGYLILRYAIPLSALLSILAAYVQSREAGIPFGLSNPLLIFLVFSTIIGGLLAVWIDQIIKQSSQRRELIEQLQTTQQELAEAVRREAMLEERGRLAREIHDTLAQGFVSIIMHLEASEQQLTNAPARAQHHLQLAQQSARESLSQARRVVQDLRPEVLEEAALPEALAHVVQKWGRETGLTAHTAVTGTPVPLHPAAETTLIRATQEALANVRQHARAQTVRVTLSYTADLILLDVQDDGRGLTAAPPSTTGGGYGLLAMRQRLAQLGGELIIESEPDEGTTLTVTIPLGEQPLA